MSAGSAQRDADRTGPHGTATSSAVHAATDTDRGGSSNGTGPGNSSLSDRTSAMLQQLESDYQRTRPRIAAALPPLPADGSWDSAISSLSDPEGDAEIRAHLAAQRERFDAKLQLALQVRLVELQGVIDAKNPSAAFLDAVAGGTAAGGVFGWTEQFKCPPPKYLARARQRASQARLGAADHQPVVPRSARAAAATGTSNRNRTSKCFLRSSAAELAPQLHEDEEQDTMSPGVSFAILPAVPSLSMNPVAASAGASVSSLLEHNPSSISLLRFEEALAQPADAHAHSRAAPSVPARGRGTQVLGYKSGHGYLTGSQTARQPLHAGGSDSAAATAAAAQAALLSSTAASAVSFSLDAVAAPAPAPSSASSAAPRWGGSTATASAPAASSRGDQQLVVREQKESSSSLLPRLSSPRFLQAVVPVAASSTTTAGARPRPPNYYPSDPGCSAPSAAMVVLRSRNGLAGFGYTEREVSKSLVGAIDQTV